MGSKKDFEQHYLYMAVVGTVVIAVNLYYYCRPMLEGYG